MWFWTCVPCSVRWTLKHCQQGIPKLHFSVLFLGPLSMLTLKSSYLGKRLQWEIYVHNYWEQHLYWKDGSRGRSWFVNTLPWRPQAIPIGALDLGFPFSVNLNIGKGACFCTLFWPFLKGGMPLGKPLAESEMQKRTQIWAISNQYSQQLGDEVPCSWYRHVAMLQTVLRGPFAVLNVIKSFNKMISYFKKFVYVCM